MLFKPDIMVSIHYANIIVGRIIISIGGKNV